MVFTHLMGCPGRDGSWMVSALAMTESDKLVSTVLGDEENKKLETLKKLNTTNTKKNAPAMASELNKTFSLCLLKK